MSKTLTADDQARFERTNFGFWLYVMTDCVLFATLFAAYAVLRNNTAGGPSGADLFKLHGVMAETLLLLTSSLTCGLFMLAAYKKNVPQFKLWAAMTFLLGAAFLVLELREFQHLVAEGASWRTSAFLSSYFTLVGTHGLHIIVGLLWMLILWVRVARGGFTASSFRKLSQLSLFWHFLDIVWIGIFTVVYLMGIAG